MNRNNPIHIIVFVFLVSALLFSAFPRGQAFASGPSVFINEIHYDNASTDTGEAIEIAGPEGTDLSGWSLVLYNGNGGGVYDTTVLSGTILDQQNGYGTLSFSYPVDGLQNGPPDGVALFDGTSVVQFLSYEGSFTAVGGPANGMVSEDIGVSEGSSTPVGFSLQLTGTGTGYGDFTWAAPKENTFGAVNSGQSFGEAPPDSAPSVVSTLPGDAATDIAIDANLEITFSEAVDVTGDWFEISCVNSDLHSALVSGGPTTFILDPEADFAYSEACTIALSAGQITDQDSDDPPDAMEADFVFGFTTEAEPVDSAPSVLSTSPADMAVGVAIDASLEITFSEAVDPSGSWFGIECGSSGSHAAGVAGGPEVFTLDPEIDFAHSEACTVVIYAAQVTDQDADDPPDAMEADFSFGFEIIGSQPVPDYVLINEVDADQVSTDSAEFIELYDGGAGNTDLTGLVLVLFNGSDDASYLSFDLDGLSTDADGYFVLCGDAANVANCDLDVSPDTDLVQNGADAVALMIGDAENFPNDTPVTTAGLVDAIVYDTNDADDAGLLVLLNAGQPQVNEGGEGNSTIDSNQRCPNGSGGARNTDTYDQFEPTPGAENTCGAAPPEVCGDPYTPIYSIQGSGSASPLVGSEVATEGIVVGDFQNNGSLDNGDLNGFYIQDPAGDGDGATSDGVFVYAPGGIDVAVGDAVRVRGSVSEYYDLTEIGASQIWMCGSGVVEPTALSLPLTPTTDLEVYEGMLVRFTQPLYISEYYAFGQFGEIVLSATRQFQPTAIYDPGSPEAFQLMADNILGRIKIDDGRTTQNPDPAIHPNGSVFDLSNLFRGGDQLINVTGVMDYNYSEYKIQPTMGAEYVVLNPRPAQPADVGGVLKVSSFNVLNYFTTLGSRGADTAEEFARQRAKIFAALTAIDADIVGLIEIENNTIAILDLVNGLNAVVGEGTYDYVDTGVIGTDEIKVAFIYKTATVSMVGDYAVLDSSVDSRFIDTKNRPSLAQTFMDNATGGIFTVVVNHLKSKGSDCNDIGDPDLGDGAGNCNLTRTAAAEALVDWLATDPTGSGDADFLIIGDLNSYDKEDPIDTLLAGGYEDMVFQFVGENAYSYVFDGQLGYLDHALALANGSMSSEVSGVTVWHINADEPSLIDYDMTYKKPAQDALYAPDPYRSSDHDPVMIGLKACDGIAPSLEIKLSADTLWPANHKMVDVTATVTVSDNLDPNPVVTLLSITSSEADEGTGDGNTPDDIVIINDFTFQLRAERSGTSSEGRTYTITYQAADDCGNLTVGTAIVTVPRDQRKK